MITLHEIQAILQRIDYPASKEEILAAVQHLGAPEAVLERLRSLPEHRYGSEDTVLDALRNLQ